MKVLIVVDMQNDFIDGSLGSNEAQNIVPNVINKIKEYENELIYFTKDTHFDDYLDTSEGKKLPVKHCIKGTNGWDIPNEILNNHNNVIEKYTFGSVELFEKLKEIENIESIELIGLCTDICVVSNALLAKAYFPNLQITVDSTCCAGVTTQSHQKALDTMKMCQIDVK
jgi:nicotinamidase-related amidase